MQPAIPTATPASSPPPGRTGVRRRRGVLSGLVLVLACLTIVIASMGIWVHQVAFNTDRFTALVTDVVADPAVIDPVAAKVSAQVVTALDLQTRIASRLPGASAALAGPMTVAVQGAIERQLQQVLANPRVQAGLLKSLSFTHEHLVRFLRGDTSALTLVDGYLTLNVFPVIGSALTEIQSIGLIPADVQLPDLSTDEAPAALKARLESRLGITLPADFGTITLMEASRLSAAQTVVKAFDIVVVALVVLSLLLCALAVWLARNRRRMVVYLAVGVVVAFIVSRFAIRSLSAAAVDGIADLGVRGAVKSVVDATLADLIGLTTIILVVTAAVGVVAYVAGRPRWLVRLASRGSAAAGSAASAGAGGVTAAAGGVAGAVPTDRNTLERVGVAAIVFAVVWIALGVEVALLGAVLVGAWLLIVRIVTDPSDDEVPPSTPASVPPA